MRLTPADVHNVAFKKPSIGKRGYDEDEVDAFLDLIEAELSRLIEENNDLAQRLAGYESGERPPTTGQDQGQVTLDKTADPGAESDTRPGAGTTAEQPTISAPVEPAAAAAQQPIGGPADHHLHAARLLGLAEETAARLTAEAQAEADSTRNSARGESEKLVNDATSQSEQLMSTAKNQSEQMMSDAKNQSEQMMKDATAQAQATTRDSQLKAEAIDREAQRKYTEVMTQLNEQRTTLEKKIDDLRTYEREYRSRLKGWISEQLAQLEDSTAGAAARAAGGAASDGAAK
jgi:DivIVA domain-containing protein